MNGKSIETAPIDPHSPYEAAFAFLLASTILVLIVVLIVSVETTKEPGFYFVLSSVNWVLISYYIYKVFLIIRFLKAESVSLLSRKIFGLILKPFFLGALASMLIAVFFLIFPEAGFRLDDNAIYLIGFFVMVINVFLLTPQISIVSDSIDLDENN